MLKKMKKIIASILTLGCMSAFAVGGLSLARANADTSIDMSSFVMENGAAVRLAKDGNGLRFSAEMKQSTYEALEVKNATYGMLIVPVDYITAGYELTVENVFGANAKYCFQNEAVQEGQKQIINAVSDGLSNKDEDALYELYGSIVELNEWNITRAFVGQAYVEVDGTYYFAPYYEGEQKNNIRSMYYVSQLAIDKNDVNAATLQTEYIDKFNTYNETENGNKKYKYTVNHILRKVDGSTETITETKGAYLNSTVAETGNTYENYILNETESVLSSKMYANGNTVIDLYYDTYKNVGKEAGNVTLYTADEIDTGVFGITFMVKPKAEYKTIGGNGGAGTIATQAELEGKTSITLKAKFNGEPNNAVYLSGLTGNNYGGIGITELQYTGAPDADGFYTITITYTGVTGDLVGSNPSNTEFQYYILKYAEPNIYFSGDGGVNYGNVTITRVDADENGWYAYEVDFRSGYDYGSGANPAGLTGAFSVVNAHGMDVEIKNMRYVTEKTLTSGETWINALRIDEKYTAVTFKVKPEGTMTGDFYYGNADVSGAVVGGFGQSKLDTMTPDEEGFYTFAYNPQTLLGGHFKLMWVSAGVPVTVKDLTFSEDTLVANNASATLKTYDELKDYDVLTFKVKPINPIAANALWYGDSNDGAFDNTKAASMMPDADGYYTLSYDLTNLKTNSGNFSVYNQTTGTDMLIKDIELLNVDMSIANGTTATLAEYADAKAYETVSFKMKPSGAVSSAAYIYGNVDKCVKGVDANVLGGMTADEDGYYTFTFDTIDLYGKDLQFQNGLGCAVYIKDITFIGEADFVYLADNAEATLALYDEVVNFSLLSFKVKFVEGAISQNALWYGYGNDEAFDNTKAVAMTPDADGYYTIYYDLSALKTDSSRNFKVYNQTTGTDMIIKNLSLTNDLVLAKKDLTTLVTASSELKNYEAISFKVKPVGTVNGALYYGYINDDAVDTAGLSAMTADADGFYTLYYDLTNLNAALTADFSVYNLTGIDFLVKGLQGENIDYVINNNVTLTIAYYSQVKTYKTITFKVKPMGNATGAAYWYGNIDKHVAGAGVSEFAVWTPDNDGFYTCTIDVIDLYGEDLKFQNNLGVKALVKDVTFSGEADAWYVKNNVTEKVLSYAKAQDYYSFTFKMKPMGDLSGAAYWYGDLGKWSAGAGSGELALLTPDENGFYEQTVLVDNLNACDFTFQNNSGADMLLKDFVLTKEIYLADNKELTVARYEELLSYNSLSFKVKLTSGSIASNALWYGYANDNNFNGTGKTADAEGFYTLYYDLETLKANEGDFKVYNQATGTDMIVKDVTYSMDRYLTNDKTITLATYEELQTRSAVTFKVKPEGDWTANALWYGYANDTGLGWDTTQAPDTDGWYTLAYDLTNLKANSGDLKIYNQTTGVSFFVKDIEYVDYVIANNATPTIISYSDVQTYETVSFKMKPIGTVTGAAYYYGGTADNLIGGAGSSEFAAWPSDTDGYYTITFRVEKLNGEDFKIQNNSGAILSIKDITYTNDYLFVTNGIAAYSIVIPNDASATEEYAAYELQYFIEQMTGATMNIVSEASAGSDMNGRLIYIGKTNMAKNALTVTDSFGIYLEEGNVIIEGQNNRGTLYGVYDFLENQFGVKFLTESYTHIPAVDGTLTISEEDIATLSNGYVSTPTIAYRAYLNTPVWMSKADDVRYATRMRFLNEFIGETTASSGVSSDLIEQTQYKMPWFASGMIGASHSSINYAAVGVYALRDYITDWENLITYSLDNNGILTSCSVNREYALANYSSIFDGNGVLDVCYASGVLKDTANLITAKSLMVAGMEYVMNNYAAAEYYMLGQQDREERCTCSVCSEQTTVSGGGFLGIDVKKYTDYKYTKSYYTANFVKAVAEQLASDGYTTQKVVMFAYGPTGDAPGQMTYNSSNKYYNYSTKITVALPSNVWVQWAPINGDKYFAVNTDSFGIAAQLSDWRTYCLGGENRFMVWTYEVNCSHYFVYAPTMHTWAENIKVFKEYGMDYVFMQSMFTDRVNPDQYMEAYVASKLLWNASTDTAAMNALITKYKNEFISYFYGSTAASYVQDYYTTFDAEYASLYGSIGYLQSNDSGKVWVLGQTPHNDMGAIPTQDFLSGLITKLNNAIAAVNADTTLNEAQKEQYVEHINRLKLTPRYMLVLYYGVEDSTLYADMKALGGTQLGENVSIPA